MMKELDLVALVEKAADSRLSPGDVGTVVHVHGQGEAYEVEFVDYYGNTLDVVTLPARALRPVADHEVVLPHVQMAR